MFHVYRVIYLLCTHYSYYQKFSFYSSPHSWPLSPFYPLLSFPSVSCLLLFGLFTCCGLYFFVFYIAQMSEIICYLSLTTWVISLSIICLRSIHAVTSGKVSYFLWLSRFHFVFRYISYLPYPIIKLFPHLGHCKICHDEHRVAHIFLN